MRRLGTLTTAFFVTLFAGTVLTLCSLNAVTGHLAEAETTIQEQSCASSCGQHGQPVNAIAQAEYDNKKDDEPAPALAYWQQEVNLLSLYLAPTLALVFISLLLRQHLLTVRLRI